MPPIARSPRTENITAGSVGAIAAPSSPLIVQPRSSAQCANSAIRPAVANVPMTPAAATGTATVRKRRRPIEEPPSNRITISAIVPTRSTVFVDGARDGAASDATAATTRNRAAEGTAMRAPSLLASSAAESAAATRRTSNPKLVRSCTPP